MEIRKIGLTTLAVAAVALVGCDDDAAIIDPVPDGPGTFSFDFESDMGGWNADGTDLDQPPVDWSVERSTQAANTGSASVRLHLENLNDAGKIWMERAFELEPNTRYDIAVTYAFGTADFGDVNLWTVITGATDRDPEQTGDLTFQGDTGHDQGSGAGLVWMEKSFDLTATTGDDGRFYLAIGVWGTYEVGRTYFVDDVEVGFTQ